MLLSFAINYTVRRWPAQHALQFIIELIAVIQAASQLDQNVKVTLQSSDMDGRKPILPCVCVQILDIVY